MQNFIQRSITGIILAAILVSCILLGKLSFICLVILINALGLLEFYRLFEPAAIHASKLMGIILSIILIITSVTALTGFSDWRFVLLTIPFTFIIFIRLLFSKSPNPFHHLAFTFMGIFYITIPAVFLALLAFAPLERALYHKEIILGYIFIVWASDSGAYATGKLAGKHPLFKRISPGKTWEGSLGGALSSLAIAIIVSGFFTDLTLTGWIITALAVIFFGTFGDLVKSMLKRSLNVKDSGRILPGHGGILDRFDSMLGSAPFVFIYLSVFS